MANKKISELQSRTPSLSDLLLVGDPSSGYSYKCTVTALATIIETDIADGYVTIGTTQTISGAKTFSNNLTLTSVSNANTDTDKFLVLNGSNVVNFRTGAEVLSDIGGQGALTLTTTGSSGASTLVGNTLNIPTYTLSGLGGISGSGSTGYLPKFTGTTSIGNSIVQDNGSTLNIAGGIICNTISASSLTSDQYIAFQNINTSYSLSGYTMLYATLTNPGFIFNFGDGTRSAIFRYAAGSYTYTLPSATGTLALTSDITNSVSGTIGFIAKFTGTGSVGISQIYESGTSIGIGTTSPSGKTEISGSASGSTFVALNLRNIDEVVGSDASMYFSTGSGALASTNITGLIRSSVTQANPSALKGNLKFYVNSGDNIIEGMQLDASGNLGLGVTPSAWDATLSKAIQLNGGSLWGYSTSQINLLQNAFYNSSGDIAYVNSASASAYRQISGVHSWYTAPSGTAGTAISFTQAMTLTASGNLGIGTTSPSNKLEVVGIGKINDVFVGGRSGTYASYTDGIFGDNLHLGATGTGGAVYINTALSRNTYINPVGGNVGIGTTAPTVFSGYTTLSLNNSSQGGVFEIQSNGTSALRMAASSSDAALWEPRNVFVLFATNNTERMRITSGGELLINTTTDAGDYKLQVDGNILIRSGKSLEFYNAGNNNGAIISSYDGGVTNGAGLRLSTGGGTVMSLTNGGNVGIGTTTPGQKLSIAGRLNFDIFSTDVDDFGMWATTSGTTLASYSTSNLLFRTNNAERMRITSTGNVGIGTTSPDWLLKIEKNSSSGSTGQYPALVINNPNAAGYSAMYFFNNTTNVGGLEYNNTSTNLSLNSYGALIFQTGSGSERMRITSAGNVGIGTTSPSSYTNYTFLTINNAVTGSGIDLDVNDTRTATFNTSASSTDIGSITNIPFAFYTNGSERMRITSGGEVYIAGTTDQGAYNLQVNGTGVWGAGAYVNGSDRMLKENIYDIDGCLELVKQLKPVTYKYKESYSKDTSTQTGFIAQDLKELFKDKSYLNGLVKEGGQHLSVAYQNLIPVLAKAIQELEAEIEILKNK